MGYYDFSHCAWWWNDDFCRWFCSPDHFWDIVLQMSKVVFMRELSAWFKIYARLTSLFGKLLRRITNVDAVFQQSRLSCSWWLEMWYLFQNVLTVIAGRRAAIVLSQREFSKAVKVLFVIHTRWIININHTAMATVCFNVLNVNPEWV